MRSSVLLWYFLISLKALIPHLPILVIFSFCSLSFPACPSFILSTFSSSALFCALVPLWTNFLVSLTLWIFLFSVLVRVFFTFHSISRMETAFSHFMTFKINHLSTKMVTICKPNHALENNSAQQIPVIETSCWLSSGQPQCCNELFSV